MASAITMKRLLSAKSIRPRIDSPPLRIVAAALLLHRILEDQGVANDLIARLQARFNFLDFVRQAGAGDDGNAAEFIACVRDVDPIAIVEVENRGGWNGSVRFLFLAFEGGGGEHSGTHFAFLFDFDADFGRAQCGIEDCSDVADFSFNYLIGIGVQAYVRGVA